MSRIGNSDGIGHRVSDRAKAGTKHNAQARREAAKAARRPVGSLRNLVKISQSSLGIMYKGQFVVRSFQL